MEFNIHINDVSETAFLTLLCHAQDARAKKSYLNDTRAIYTVELLKKHSADSAHHLHPRLLEKKVKSKLVAHTALRAKRYDQYIRNYLNQFPEALVINIGCGLDDRFERIDNGRLTFFDLDLPDIINIKKQIFPETERYRQISSSVFDFEWMDKIQNDPVILVAEGVFMYCREQDVKDLFFALQKKFKQPQIVCEVFNSKWLSGWRKKITEIKLNKELKFGEGATYKFGIPDSEAIESWDKGMKLIGDWSYLDSDELSSTLMKLMGRSDSMRKVQWTVHYQL